MNKFGFISCITTFILFFPFIPLGIYFGNGSNSWLGFNTFILLPIEILNYNGINIYFWGTISNNSFHLWLDIHPASFFYLGIFSLLSITLSFIGCCRENKKGKELMVLNLILLIAIILYFIIVLPFFSDNLLGITLNLFEIFLYFGNGFFILIFDLIIAIIAVKTHPIKE